MMLKGIDVSVWNGTINWFQAKKDIDFAILRVGYGRDISQEDTKFDANYRGCKTNKIPVGGYWYNYAKTVDDAKKEADACIKILAGRKLDYPLWYDIEENSVFATGKNNVSEIAKTFCEELKKAGYKVGIYSSYSGLKNYFTDEVKEAYDIWVAHVGNGGAALDSTSYPGHKEMWQYSWKGSISGISGDVDEDYCYADYSEEKVEEVEPKPEKKEEEVKPETKPEIKPEIKPEVKPVESGKVIDVNYGVFLCKTKRWLGDIKNTNDVDDMGYAGIENNAIGGLTIRVAEGSVQYRVHTRGGRWLGWIKESNRNDWNKGIAGTPDIPIDGIQAELLDVPGYQIKYRVSTVNSNGYLPWVSGLEDYAGLYGQTIDKIQIKIEKV